MNKLADWLDHRTGYRHLMREALYERIPGGARWRYVWGSTLTFTFFLQVVTGLFLWSAYSPSTLSAWESVYFIQNVMTFGWLVRGIHHFAAQAMMVLLALHFMQIVIDGAYRAPREINFWIGLILMQIVLGLSLTGYLLPWDQKGYYATQVATKIVGVTPVVGPQVQQIVQGGSSYGHLTLTRFFMLHAGLLPLLMVPFLALHIALLRKHGLHAKQPIKRPDGYFWPEQVLKDAVACLAVLATILYLATFRGAELSGPADPAEAYSAARPEWYFLFLFRFLKFEIIEEFGLAFGAIYLPGLLMLVVFLMPIVGRWKLGHRFNVGFVFVMLVGISYLTVIAMIEDARNPDHQAAVALAERDGHRAVALAKKFSIPPEGTLALLRTDPLTQGPRLFARNCASCHRYDGHDGMHRPVLVVKDGQSTEAPATAADLGGFGKREWMRKVLVEYHAVFAPLANMQDKAAGQRFLEGDMAGWSKDNQAVLSDPANKESVDALVDFLLAQGQRTDVGELDPAKVKQGREIFATGQLKSGAFSSACTDCHSMKPLGEQDALSENSGTGAPTMTGYGGKAWLEGFLKAPGHADHYGENNAMPAFDKLSPAQMQLLVNWLTGEYYLPNAEH